ncbi:hypothetical protein [Hyphomonas johnsonii]|uniref:Uncharacterized protein n=1 Tax=Hyphomonas johnsonii MHS-2 TaxID=1280950 RepID=A0A059FTN4_9PROT|nr:hypothetical protein [Hyphomonas johnsonii]KCZ94020.1 hypothetical protein HJO_01555 [Hyphomonas johnsonii MHS-2]
MKRFLVLFAVMLVISLALMWGMLAQNGYDLFAPSMSGMLLVAFLVAAYVAFRVSRILARRAQRAEDAALPGDAPKSGLLAGLFNSKSAAHQAREARVAARRKQLIAEGKLEDDTPAEAAAAPAPTSEVPTRVPQSASVQEKMDARRERYRRAKEAGKI